MNTREFVAIGNRLLKALPGFTIKGPLMFLAPVTTLLRGISFEPSAFDDKSFYVDKFVMPLCVPTQHLYFLFGDRIRRHGGGDRWSAEMPNLIDELELALKNQAVPFLMRAISLADFVAFAEDYSGNPHTPKAVAFALARAGRVGEALKVIDDLVPRLDMQVEWQVEIADQLKDLKNMLVRSPSEAIRQLEAWEAESVRSLGLEEFR